MKFTISDLDQKKAAGLIRDYVVVGEVGPGKKKSKYGNKKVEVDCHVFPSKREATRYFINKTRLLAGEIRDLMIQVPFELNPGGTHSMKYLADFTYYVVATGEFVVEDAKGAKTQVYLKKRKLMLQVHGIEIKEV
jgi:hypothetical protein